ncbi:hypothetical protein K7W03_23445 [Sphingobium sp. PNB]|uniref:hypothetical protein n=1 Tax=Sphingobium sp. PNB TaxID=863934 RepID=UPI001CA3F0EA|nr:hypothetical protein [Sphingobium sp. PNB]MCB4862550.1 hypothetical protein [Sphingobium sp. PNB]
MLTILTSKQAPWDEFRPLMTKLIGMFEGELEKVPYGRATLYDVKVAYPQNLEELASAISQIHGDEYACVIRGELIDPDNTLNIKRKSNDENPTFRDFACPWIMLDIDELSGVGLLTDDDRFAKIESILPPDFQDVSYFYQWSSSAGVEGWDVLKIHLWFWLDTPATTDFLRTKAAGEGWTVDHQVFKVVQPHFTAKPIFVDMDDPLGDGRCGFRYHTKMAASLSDYQEPVREPREFIRNPGVSGRQARLEQKLDEITGSNLNYTVISAAMSYAKMWGDEADYNEIYQLLEERIQSCFRSSSRIREEMSKLRYSINSALRKR